MIGSICGRSNFQTGSNPWGRVGEAAGAKGFRQIDSHFSCVSRPDRLSPHHRGPRPGPKKQGVLGEKIKTRSLTSRKGHFSAAASTTVRRRLLHADDEEQFKERRRTRGGLRSRDALKTVSVAWGNWYKCESHSRNVILRSCRGSSGLIMTWLKGIRYVVRAFGQGFWLLNMRRKWTTTRKKRSAFMMDFNYF